MRKRESGFSLIELIIVAAIVLIVAAMAAPRINRVMDNYRLNATGHSMTAVLQQARMLAVQTNQPYYVQIDTTQVPNIVGAVPATRFNPGTSTLTYASGDPKASTAANIIFQSLTGTTSGPLDTAVGGAPPSAQINGIIGFNARGMPCIPPTTNAWLCTANGGFEWFMTSNATGSWEAITVSPAGRIRSWRLSSASSGTWQ